MTPIVLLFAGFRIPLTLDDPEVWYAANRYAGWLLLIYGLVLLVAALGLSLVLGGLPAESATGIYALSVGVVAIVGLVPVALLSWRYARRLAKDRQE